MHCCYKTGGTPLPLAADSQMYAQEGQGCTETMRGLTSYHTRCRRRRALGCTSDSSPASGQCSALRRPEAELLVVHLALSTPGSRARAARREGHALKPKPPYSPSTAALEYLGPGDRGSTSACSYLGLSTTASRGSCYLCAQHASAAGSRAAQLGKGAQCKGSVCSCCLQERHALQYGSAPALTSMRGKGRTVMHIHDVAHRRVMPAQPAACSVPSAWISGTRSAAGACLAESQRSS